MSDACVVLRVVLTVFTSLSVKPFDLGYRGDNVICSICCSDMNLARSSDEKWVCWELRCTSGVHIC